MNQQRILPDEILTQMHKRVDKMGAELTIPPPVFLAMKGEFLFADLSENRLRCRFPVLEQQLNPFGYMQGGIISAAVDNTIGPLSMLIAPPNVTKKMETKYILPVNRDIDFIYVTATFMERKKQLLYFEASVTDEADDTHFATVQSTHWIV